MLPKKDFLILDALKRNSRQSIKEIANETGIPRATVFDRIKKLSGEKVIKAFTIDIDHEKTGDGTLAFILVKFTPESGIKQGEVAKTISKLHGIDEVYIISGDWDILLKVRAPSLKELGELVVDKLRMTEGVSDTVTCACFKSIK